MNRVRIAIFAVFLATLVMMIFKTVAEKRDRERCRELISMIESRSKAIEAERKSIDASLESDEFRRLCAENEVLWQEWRQLNHRHPEWNWKSV